MKNDLLKICQPKEKYISQLKSIWKTCFGDTDKYIDFFFENKYPFCYTITAVYDDEPVAVTYLMPITITEYGKTKKGFYLYALGVLPEYRKNGIGQSIIKEVCDYCTTNNCFCILSPASEKLVDYYNRLGFVENAYVTVLEYRPQDLYEDVSLYPLNTEKFENLRNAFFDNPIYWNKNSLDYVLKENSFANGHNLFFTDNNKEYFAVVRINGDVLTIIESNVELEHQQCYTDYFCQIFNCLTAQWYIPQIYKDKNPLLMGMSFNLAKDNYYLNHILN